MQDRILKTSVQMRAFLVRTIGHRRTEISGLRGKVDSGAVVLAEKPARHAAKRLVRMTTVTQTRRTWSAMSSKKTRPSLPAVPVEMPMKTIKKMALLAIMASMTVLGLTLGGCHASIGVEGEHAHHAHGDNCGHHWDGHHWR